MLPCDIRDIRRRGGRDDPGYLSAKLPFHALTVFYLGVSEASLKLPFELRLGHITRFPDFGLCRKKGRKMPKSQDGYVSSREDNNTRGCCTQSEVNMPECMSKESVTQLVQGRVPGYCLYYQAEGATALPISSSTPGEAPTCEGRIVGLVMGPSHIFPVGARSSFHHPTHHFIYRFGPTVSMNILSSL